MKFNLNRYAKKNSKDGDVHQEKKLQRDHSGAPRSTTEKQLDKDRVAGKDVVLEKLLDSKRLGGADKIIEKNLNDAKGGLMKHRDSKASSGDINKVEELRLSKAKQEDEKYKAASSTPKEARWWEHLKANASNKRMVTAYERYFDESERWNRLEDTWSEWSEDEGVEIDPVELPNIEDDDVISDQVVDNPVTIDEVRPVDSPIAKGLYIKMDIAPEGFQLGMNELQQAAYDAIISGGYGYLANVVEFTPASFKRNGDQLVARLIGDEHYPSEQATGQESPEELSTETPFTVSGLEKTEIEGVVLGTVNVKPDMIDMVQDMDDTQLRIQLRDAIAEAHPTINVEDDGIDLDKLSTGQISFVGQVSQQKKKRKSESWENVQGGPIASTNFDIVVLSNTKKNWILQN